MRYLLVLLFPICSFAQDYSEKTVSTYDSLGVPWKFLKKLGEDPLIERDNSEVRLLYYTAYEGFKYYRLETDTEDMWLRTMESPTERFSRATLKRQQVKATKDLVNSITDLVDKEFFHLPPSTRVKGQGGYFIYIEAYSKNKYHFSKRWMPEDQDDGWFFIELINSRSSRKF